MRKITLHMNMTFDGFFNLEWMGQMPPTPDQELNDDTIALINTPGNAFVGYPFYAGMVSYWFKVENNPSTSENERAIAHAVNSSHRIVISRTEEKLEGEHAELLVVKNDRDLVEAITKLKQQQGPDFGLIGGVRTAQAFVRLGLIDEYNLLVHPVVLGNGERVFTDMVNLKLISTKTYKSGVMRVCYQHTK